MEKYPSLSRFSKYISIPAGDLMEAFEVERDFHQKILAEKSKAERINLYNKLYSTVHPIYQRNNHGAHHNGELISRKALLFKKELEGRSVLDVGCGQGAFLKTLAKRNHGRKLCGLDVSLPTPEIMKQYQQIEFTSADITEFKVEPKYDVVYSNHVLEHMAPADLHTHLSSIKEALNDKGTLIINMPNRLFGPSDVTRIIDFSYTNKIDAQGSHFSEMTYHELIPILKQYGFGNFKTVLPHTKLRYLLPSFRMSPAVLCKIEKSAFVMNLLHRLKFRGTCIAKLEITLICQKDY